jgi:hypothetical protein|tara:strand:- start:134 stop:358 length:225 start_codon:yes stop_codon:yes gene_type:complete
MSKPLNLQSTGDVILEVPGVGIMLAHGSAVPADNSDGYAPGCIFILTGGSSLNTVMALNVGTKADCNFDAAINA